MRVLLEVQFVATGQGPDQCDHVVGQRGRKAKPFFGGRMHEPQGRRMQRLPPEAIDGRSGRCAKCAGRGAAATAAMASMLRWSA